MKVAPLCKIVEKHGGLPIYLNHSDSMELVDLGVYHLHRQTVLSENL